jgi:hypothetical protein
VQAIQWALANQGLYESEFFKTQTRDNKSGSEEKTKKFVRDALKAFLEGKGLWICHEYYVGGKATPEGQAAFRAKVCNLIHRMVGREPRCVEEKRRGQLQFAIKPVW